MPARDLDLLIDAARGAGEIATRYSGATAQRWDKPGGAGPVTEADLAVDAYLREKLCGARPGYGWLSEESEDDGARHSAQTVFIVDPIDGTRNFVDGGRTWAHSLAVAHGGRITAGVVFLPRHDRLFAAALDEGATLNGSPIRARAGNTLTDAEILTAKFNLEPEYWHTPPRFQRAYRPSLAYRMALVGEGRFDGMITFRPTWEWDIAAGSLIASEAGAIVTDRTGAALSFNHPDPRANGVIATAAALHPVLTAAHRASA